MVLTWVLIYGKVVVRRKQGSKARPEGLHYRTTATSPRGQVGTTADQDLTSTPQYGKMNTRRARPGAQPRGTQTDRTILDNSMYASAGQELRAVPPTNPIKGTYASTAPEMNEIRVTS